MQVHECVPYLAVLIVLLAPVVLAQDTQPTVVQVLDVAPAWSGHSVGYCLLTKDGRQYVAYYDHERAMTVAMRDLESPDWTFKRLPERVNWDSHHYITMSMDEGGHLHVSGNMHGDPLVYFRTEEPYAIETLRREKRMVGENEKRCTYPQFLTDAEGNLLFLYRDGKSGDGVQLVNRYDAKAKSWSRLLSTPLFDGLGKVSCYPEGPFVGPDGCFHLIWVWRATGACETNHLLCYARSKDMVHWESAAGTPITLPMSPESKETIIDPVPIEGGMINESTVVGFDTQERTILSYHKFDADGNTQIYNARFQDGAWRIYQTSDWNHRWFFSGGGTIEVDVDLGPVTVSRTGALIQGYKHVKHGTGVWILDEDTLKPVESIPGGPGVTGSHDVPTSTYPDMKVRWKADENPADFDGSRYFLR
ncbi:MAG: hypothetical protein GY851_31590, partial [bacterium]|nr:hypothetical protein [bacterium]